MSKKLEIFNLLKSGAKSRDQLVSATGLPDRSVRLCIEELKRDGELIVSFAGVYKITDDLKEMEAYMALIDARLRSSHFIHKAMRREIAKRRGYKVIKVRAHERRIM